jgi:hypothetical protein
MHTHQTESMISKLVIFSPVLGSGQTSVSVLLLEDSHYCDIWNGLVLRYSFACRIVNFNAYVSVRPLYVLQHE